MKAQHALLTVISAIILILPLQGQIPQTISYQGMIGDSLGVPKPDDTYSFTFRLYNSADGSSALWEETKDLPVKYGLFTTRLGDVTPLGTVLEFDQSYWLGIQFGSEPELAPRLPLTSVGYSFHAMRADSARYAAGADTARFVINAPAPTGPAGGALTGFYPNPALDTSAVMGEHIMDDAITPAKISVEGSAPGQVLMSNSTEVIWQTPPVSAGDITGVMAGIGLTDGGTTGDVALNVNFGGGGVADSVARSDHGHAGEDITSGTVAETRIDPAIARDDEIMPTVLASDGSGSGLHADSLDGFDASDFAAAAHAHAGSDITSAVEVADSAAKAPWSGIADIPAGFSDGVDNTGGDDHSLDADDGGPVDVVYVDYSGQVGIGTTEPASTLDVNGTVIAAALDVNGAVAAIELDISENAAIAGSLTASSLDASGTVTAANASVAGAVTTGTLTASGTVIADSLALSSGVSVGGNLVVGGGQAVKWEIVGGDYMTSTSDRVVLCTGEETLIILHPASDAPGQLLSIRNVGFFGENVVDVVPAEGVIIEGSPEFFISLPGEEGFIGVTFVSAGGSWWIISTFPMTMGEMPPTQ